jgi:hypothetical protein
VDDQLVIRMSSPLDQVHVGALKKAFAGILIPGGDMHLAGPFDDEMNEPELAHLPRLVMDFNKRDFGRLRQMVDAINDF